MPDIPLEAPNIAAIYLEIAQYPIMAREIRHRMREEIYKRGIITPQRFEEEMQAKALLSQRREGLVDPLVQEDERNWKRRLRQVQDYLTDFYFAYNLPIDLFHRIVEGLLAERSARPDETALTFNPELASLDLLLRQLNQYETLPEDQQARVGHHLEEIKVVLIKTMISDHLEFLRVAKAWFGAKDFEFIRARRIGHGKIGGKAAGMLLAWKILQASAPRVAEQIVLPESYFIGADVFYDFLLLNGIEYINQKYKPMEQIRADYGQIMASYERGRFPEEIADQLRTVLQQVGKKPLIVRSSSLLEDNFGTSFAGKYASYFCPNQGTLKENLRELTLAIRRIYASVYSPDALFYRRRMGLLDYDERMPILLQEVQGKQYRNYFFPDLAGVAFSYTPVVWSPRLRREEGFIRLVSGLGTRAVERVGEDYARLVTLSHPMLRPEVPPAAIRRYSQHYMDVIDIEGNAFTTLPVGEVLGKDYGPLYWVASLDQGDALLPLFFVGPQTSPDHLVLTHDNLLQRSTFVPMLKTILSTLAGQYGSPVDMEFAITFGPDSSKPQLTFHLLQCRPQSSMQGEAAQPVPADLPAEDQLFVALRMVPQGQVSQVEYIIYVDPVIYSRVAEPTRRPGVARIVGRLNKELEGKNFVLIGPGRWGSSNSQLGVPVSYADIYNARALIELAVAQAGVTPDPSYGTHFFQDLMEAHIYPLAIYPDEPGDFLNRGFLDRAHNCLPELLPDAAGFCDCVKVIHVPSERRGRLLEIAMDGRQALGYLRAPGPVPAETLSYPVPPSSE